MGQEELNRNVAILPKINCEKYSSKITQSFRGINDIWKISKCKWPSFNSRDGRQNISTAVHVLVFYCDLVYNLVFTGVFYSVVKSDPF